MHESGDATLVELGSADMPADHLQFGPFRLDPQGRRLWRKDKEVPLTPKAMDLLAYLASHAGQVLSREHLLEALWTGTFVDDHALSVQIREIRKALGDGVKEGRYIETRHRRGYCFIAEVQTVAPVNFTRPVPDAPGPETRYAHSGDVNIAYQVVGNGPVDVIFVMGWVSHLEYFWQEPRFAQFLRRLSSFSRLILFDKRGTGLSDRVPIAHLPTLEQRMDDVRAVMEAAGSQKAVLCGVSEGGPMSALFAATYPEKTLGLVMIGSYARRLRDSDYPWGPTAEDRELFLREIQDHWGGPIGIEERAPSLMHDAAFRDWWATYLRMGASPGAAMALTRMNMEIDIRSVLPAVRVPTLVLHRTGDQCLKVEEGRYLASRIPGARFVELPGDDHLPFAGNPDDMLREIESFLAGVAHTEGDRVLATVLSIAFAPLADRTAADRLRAQIRSEMQWFRGSVLDAGDHCVIAAFDGPARAIRCACAIAEYADRQEVDLRAGLHTGEVEMPLLRGPAVDIAAAVRDQAASRQVLVSGTVADLVAGSGIRFEEHGRIERHDLDAAWRLLRVMR